MGRLYGRKCNQKRHQPGNEGYTQRIFFSNIKYIFMVFLCFSFLHFVFPFIFVLLWYYISFFPFYDSPPFLLPFLPICIYIVFSLALTRSQQQLYDRSDGVHSFVFVCVYFYINLNLLHIGEFNPDAGSRFRSFLICFQQHTSSD